jgi:DeoD family purine-nucleoside phosphorylase
MARLEDIELPEGDAPDTLHLNPAARFHPLVLLPGDPARAMAIATQELDAPRMFNHRRGLWGYSGTTPDGTGLTIQSSGMGGPSAAIVVEELCDLGAEMIVRVGTCGSLDPRLALGDLIVAGEVLPEDGAGRALAGGGPIAPDPQLTTFLSEYAGASTRPVRSGPVASVDLFYDPDAEARYQDLRDRGALAIEMEAATVLALARRRGVRGACLLGVTDVLAAGAERARLPQPEIERLGLELGAIAAAAVGRAASG